MISYILVGNIYELPHASCTSYQKNIQLFLLFVDISFDKLKHYEIK